MTESQTTQELGNILIVDDKLENIRFLANFLSLQGYSIRKATNGKYALNAAKMLPPDLILLDINMPEMGGYEVCECLKNDPQTRDVPVIFLSAGNEVEDKLKAFQAGGVDYITKPFQLEEVLARVKTQLNLKTLQQQLKIKNEELQGTITGLKKAQADVEASQRELLALLKSMNELIYVLDAQGRYLKIANTNTKLLSQPAEEILGKTIYDVLPQATAQLLLIEVREALARQETREVEYSFTIGQTKIEASASLSPISGDSVLCVVRDISDRKRREEALKLIVEGTASKTGQDFFQACVQYLAEILGIRYAFITECVNPQKTRVRMLSFWNDQNFHENLEYDLAGTPCDEVITNGQYYCYPDNIIAQFPDDADLVDLKARSYAGIPLIDTSGDVIGHIAVLDTHPMIDDQTRKLVLKIFAARAGAELERKITDIALQKSQEQTEGLLLNILPKAIADRLKTDTSAIAEQFDDVTILFSDIVGFTPLSAQLQPTELVNLLNEIFSTFDALSNKLGLEKIKTIGDAYMVVGGLPVKHPNSAEAIAQMALEMQSSIAQFQSRYGPTVQIRIGINTGPVVAGVIGVKKFSYDLWGDAVNVASRMESSGIPGKIQVTETVYERLKHQFHFEQRGTVDVKGRGKMMTYWLVG
ncbi:adenylate/guanylate cyclase domain-containing protein [Laspinema olomoucense]|uniref:adenylate/guanylate cyclase domain-containing protein n=1 Tax=Laspinema olomoucense TaxID=3231600 RepID=UPI0021BBB11D|nr:MULTISPECIES: adenylate/guanylate cyclase domain-containing protein [unclassified Laspinema]MCT7988198.1 response regulator [Laspinema sp. D3a]MCT7994704.1 response regulator [Laspinema sp. D3c]